MSKRSFEVWVESNSYPWETREDAKKRYEARYGPVPEEKPLDTSWVEEWRSERPEPREEEDEEGFLSSTLGEFGSGAAKSWDEFQAGLATKGEHIVAPWLDKLGSLREGEQRAEKYADAIREWAPEYRKKQLEEAAQYPEIKTRLQKRQEEDPTYKPAETREETLARLKEEGGWKYKVAKELPEFVPLSTEKFAEDLPTAGEMGSYSTSTVIPMAAGGAAALGAYASGLGPVATAGLAMLSGGTAASSMVAAQTADEVKDHPIIRKALEIDPDIPFEKLSPIQQSKINEIASHAAQNNLGMRLISSGIPEMIGYIPAGGWLVRGLADVVGGTTSEVWDIAVSRQAMLDALIDGGVDPNKVAELEQAFIEIGPKKSEVFVKALAGEFVATAGFTSIEQTVKSALPKRDHRVDASKTDTKLVEEKKEAAEKKAIETRIKKVEEEKNKRRVTNELIRKIVALHDVNPEAAVQEFQDLKLAEGRIQNDVASVLAEDNADIFRDIAQRIGEGKRRETIDKALDKFEKDTARIEKEQEQRAERERIKAEKREAKRVADAQKQDEAEATEADKETQATTQTILDAAEATEAEIETTEVVTPEPEYDESTDVKSENYVLNAVPPSKTTDQQKRFDEGRVSGLTDEELKSIAKEKRRVIKDAKKLGLDTTPLDNDVKALQNEQKRRKKTTTKTKVPTIEEEVVELLQSVDKGGIPLTITKKIRGIAKAIDIKILKSDKPTDVIDKIRAKARGEAETVVEETPEEKEMITVKADAIMKELGIIKKFDNLKLYTELGNLERTLRTKRNTNNKGRLTLKGLITKWYNPSGTRTTPEGRLSLEQVDELARGIAKNENIKITKTDTTEDILNKLQEARETTEVTTQEVVEPVVEPVVETPTVKVAENIPELAGRFERVRLSNQPGRSDKSYKFSPEESEMIGRPGSDKYRKFEAARKKYRETDLQYIQTNLDRLSKFIAKNPKDMDVLPADDSDFIKKNQKEFDSRLAELKKPVEEEVKPEYKVPNLEPILKKGYHEEVIEAAGGTGGDPRTDKIEGGAKVPIEFLHPQRKQRVEDIKGEYDEGMMNYEDYKDDWEFIIQDDINDGKYAEETDMSDVWDNENMDSVLPERFAKALVRQQKAQIKADKVSKKVVTTIKDKKGNVKKHTQKNNKGNKSLVLTEEEVTYTLSRDEIDTVIDDFKNKTNLKDKDVTFRVLDRNNKDDVTHLTEIIGEAEANEIFENAEAFVPKVGDVIYIIDGNIKGYKKFLENWARKIYGRATSGAGRLINILFHEVIGHYGLRKFLGKGYNGFIKRFVKLNKKVLKDYAVEGTGQEYLPPEIKNIADLDERTEAYDNYDSAKKEKLDFLMAEEYIASHFAEFGARDPNIINRIVVALRNKLSEIPLFSGVTINQVKTLLAEIQQDYIGGKRNFLLGEDFAPVRFTAHTAQREKPKEKVEEAKKPEATGEAEEEIETLTISQSKLVNDHSLNFSKRTKPVPKKTIKGYKLFKMKKTKKGEVFPLFIGATEAVPVNEWQDADFISTKGFADRGGWHLSDFPFAVHIGTERKGRLPTKRPPDQIWAEVEVADDVDWQPEANKRAVPYAKTHKRAGEMNPATAEIKDGVPTDGNYRYKTNPNMEGEWIIAGSMKINRFLSDGEVESINEKSGFKDLPRDTPLDAEAYGVEVGTAESVPSDKFIEGGRLNYSKRFLVKPDLEKLVKEGKIKKYNTTYSPLPKKDAVYQWPRTFEQTKKDVEERNSEVAYYDPNYIEKFEKELAGTKGDYWTRPKFKEPKDLGEAGNSKNLRDEAKEGVVYRGMSDAEYKTIVERGFIESAGHKAFEPQKGMTFFTTSLRESGSYAQSFSSNELAPHFEAPVWIVGIKEPAKHRLGKYENLQSWYRPILGKISSNEIVEVFKGNVIHYKVTPDWLGDVEVRWEKYPTKEVRSKTETAEGKLLTKINQSKAFGIYARYNKDAGVDGTMLLHRNTRPNEGKYRITFFKADGELDMARTENGIGHEHFPTLAKAKSRLAEVGEGRQDISGGRKVNMSRKRTTFTEELAQAEAKINPVAFARGAERRVKEGIKDTAKRESVAESYGAAYRVDITDEAVQKYLDSKSEEGHGTFIGTINLSKKLPIPEELYGELAVGSISDRLIRGVYKPTWGRKSVHAGNIFLGGGPGYAFDKNNKGKGGRGVWASQKGSTTKTYNAVIDTEANYGYIIVGKEDMHMSNIDVWNVAYRETLDALKLGNKETGQKPDIELLDESARKAVTKYVPEFEGKIKTFKELMELGLKNELSDRAKTGKELAFESRKPIIKFLFGKMRAKKNNLVGFQELMRRTSAYPDAKMGDLVGILKFHRDKPNFLTNAKELGIKEHPSYQYVLQGEGIILLDTPIPLKTYGKEWLMQGRRRFDDKGRLKSIQKPFFAKGQTDFAQENTIYSAEVISWMTGKPATSGKFKGEVVTKKPPRGERFRKRTVDDHLKGALKSIDYTRPAFKITPEALIEPIKRTKEARKQAYNASRMLSYNQSTVAEGRLNWDGGHWIPTFKWQDKLAHKLTRRLISQGTLIDTNVYKDIRRRNKGVIMMAEQAGEKLFNLLRKSKQQQVLFEYFTTPHADATLITNPVERKAAIAAKKQIKQIGRDLVTKGLMTQESLDKYDDQYLPRKYLKYLLGDSDFNAISKGGAGVKLDLGYTKKRGDIPAGIAELIYGEIKDPAYLASISISTPVRDMAILDMFEVIASEGLKENRGWVLPKTLVKFNTIGEMKKLAGTDQALIDALQLMDTEGVKISGHWLLNEADRIQDLVDNHLTLDNKKEKLARALIKTMNNKGKEIVGQVLPKDYRRVPKGRKYGRLSGMAIRKEIFEDLFGWGAKGNTFDINADGSVDQSWAERILGTGGTFEQYNRLWKWSKVSANPPSWVRNFVSNMIFMSLGPVPMWRLPDLFIRSLDDQIRTRMVQSRGSQKDFDELTTHTKLADKMGLTSGGFSQTELKMIRNDFIKSKNNEKGVLGLFKIRDSFKRIGLGFQRKTSDLYGGIDTLGKVMMLKYLKGQGMSDSNAAMSAEKWLFDYSNPLPSVKYLRKSAFGAPFLSYPSFVAPLLIETIIKRPWKFAPYIILAEYMKNSFKEANDIDDEQYSAVMGTLSKYLRDRANLKGDLSLIPESVLPLPVIFGMDFTKDSLGRGQIADAGYFFPWGMFAEVWRELDPTKDEGSQITDAFHTVGLLSSPLINLATTALTHRDPFTDKEIYDEFASTGEKYSAWINYAFNLTMPPMFHGLSPVGGANYGWWKNTGAGGFGALTRLYESYSGKVGREGEPKFTPAQAVARMFGFNITPIAPFEARAKNVYFEVQKIKKLQRQIAYKYRKGMEARYTKEELKDLLTSEIEKLNNLIKKLNERVSKKLPESLKRSEKERLRAMEDQLKYMRTLKAG